MNQEDIANKWSSHVNAAFVQLKNAADKEGFLRSVNEYVAVHNESEPHYTIKEFGAVPLAELHLSSNDIRNDISWDGNAEARIGLPIIALFMLALACFNYLNIAVVSAIKRLKEIGLRKTIGAKRRSIAVQFVVENIILTGFAALVGLVLCVFIFIPWFNTLTMEPMGLRVLDLELWAFIGITLLVTGLVSGI